MTKIKFRCMKGGHTIFIDREDCEEIEMRNNRIMLKATCPDHGNPVWKIPKKSEL